MKTYGDFVEQLETMIQVYKDYGNFDDIRDDTKRQSSYILVKADRRSITLKSVFAYGDKDAMQKFGITDNDMELSMAVNEMEYRLISLDIDLWISGTCASNNVFDFS